MRTYWHILNIGIQSTLGYRINFLVRTIFNLIPLLAIIIMWRAIYAGKDNVAGYSLAEMVSYYVLVTVVDSKEA